MHKILCTIIQYCYKRPRLALFLLLEAGIISVVLRHCCLSCNDEAKSTPCCVNCSLVWNEQDQWTR